MDCLFLILFKGNKKSVAVNILFRPLTHSNIFYALCSMNNHVFSCFFFLTEIRSLNFLNKILTFKNLSQSKTAFPGDGPHSEPKNFDP